MVLLTWLVPLLISLIPIFTTNVDFVKLCVPIHTSSKWLNFVTTCLIFIALVAIYILYGKIIVKYWGLKRKMSAMYKKNLGIADRKSIVIAAKAQKILTFLKDSKYVFFVLFVVTVCWMPWIVLVFYDFTFHQLGSLQKTKEIRCGHAEAISHKVLTLHDEFLGKSCIYGLLNGCLMQCEVPGDEVAVCEAVHDHLHDFLIVCIMRLCMLFSLLGSLINPIIHGLWYPGFREAAKYLLNRWSHRFKILTFLINLF